MGHPPFGPLGRDESGKERKVSLGAGKKQCSGQGSPGGHQARLGPGFPFFLSLILFLLSFFILGILHLVWTRMSQSPTARITKSKRMSNALARRQKKVEDFPPISGTEEGKERGAHQREGLD